MKNARLLAVAIALAAGIAAAAESEPVPLARQYERVLEALRNNPSSQTALLRLAQPTDPNDPQVRAAFDRIVDALKESAAKKPSDFFIAYNYYRVLWKKYEFFRDPNVATAAADQMVKATSLADPFSNQPAMCSFDMSLNILAMDEENAKQAFKGKSREVVIKMLEQTRRRGRSSDLRPRGQGPYARRAALAMGILYAESGDAELAESRFREAIRLDTTPGYVTNRAYDHLGRLMLAAGNVEAAEAMLESAGRAQPDSSLKSLGYAWQLARALIDKGRFQKPIEYLEKGFRVVQEAGTRPDPDLVYGIAYAYTKLGKADDAIRYWGHYESLVDPNEEQRKEGLRLAKELATKTPVGP
jgi:tetratricopeptide (TPR) repeat protein